MQEQQALGPLVGEGEVLGEGPAEREPGVDQAVRGRGGAARGSEQRGDGGDGPAQQFVGGDLVLVGHAVLDGVEGAAVEQVGGVHLVPGVTEPVGGLVDGGAQAEGGVEEDDLGHGYGLLSGLGRGTPHPLPCLRAGADGRRMACRARRGVGLRAPGEERTNSQSTVSTE